MLPKPLNDQEHADMIRWLREAGTPEAVIAELEKEDRVEQLSHKEAVAAACAAYLENTDNALEPKIEAAIAAYRIARRP
jgi:hypothetical protein